MRCEMMFHARADARGELRTVGLLLKSDRLMHFYPVKGQEAYASTFNADLEKALAKMSPSEVFSYYTGNGNGVTSDWSSPFSADATTEDEAAALRVATIGPSD